MLAQLAIGSSVGAGGQNTRTDVQVVQLLLNAWQKRAGQPLLKIDGIAGPLTCGAILSCQRALRLPVVDGRVDPSGPILKALGTMCLEDLSSGVRASPARAYTARGSGPMPAPDALSLLWTLLAASRHMPR